MANWRWQLVEYAEPVPLVRTISEATGRSRQEVRDILNEAGERAARTLNVQENPIRVAADMVRATNLAGLLLLRPGLELEIAPKFLGNAKGWREDFFVIASLARHGKLLAQETLSASAASNFDLMTILARALLDMFWANHRRPVRNYKSGRTLSFTLDGDFDPVDLFLPDEDGFEQSVTSYSQQNEFNAVIRAAAISLAPLVGDAEVRLKLERLGHVLPRQSTPKRLVTKRLPSRSRAWEGIYELSLDILRGLGGSYTPGGIQAPGYILNTWQAWEALLTISLRNSLGNAAVRAQHEHRLGTSLRGTAGIRPIMVTPDLLVIPKEEINKKFIVDAKYKGRIGKGTQNIEAADLYEAVAFSKATGCSIVVLAYPRVPVAGWVGSLGSVALIEKIEVDGTKILAVDAVVTGIAAPGAFRLFGQRLAEGLTDISSQAYAKNTLALIA